MFDSIDIITIFILSSCLPHESDLVRATVVVVHCGVCCCGDTTLVAAVSEEEVLLLQLLARIHIMGRGDFGCWVLVVPVPCPCHHNKCTACSR